MTFIVQNDDGDEDGANAYIDVAYFKDYHDLRKNEYEDDSDLLQAAILEATGYIDNFFDFDSETTNDLQDTEFPRKKWEGIPTKVKQATAEYALRAIDADGNIVRLAPDSAYESNGMQIASFKKKIGPIEKEVAYVAGSQYGLRSYPGADNLLKQFLGGGTFGSFEVVRR